MNFDQATLAIPGVSEDEIFGLEQPAAGLRMGDTYVRRRAGEVMWKSVTNPKVLREISVGAGEEFRVAQIYRPDQQVLLRDVVDERRSALIGMKALKREWKRVARAPMPKDPFTVRVC